MSEHRCDGASCSCMDSYPREYAVGRKKGWRKARAEAERAEQREERARKKQERRQQALNERLSGNATRSKF